MSELRSLPANTPARKVRSILEEDGGVILTGMMDDATADRLYAEMKPYIEKTANGSDPFTGYSTTRTGAIVARSATGRKLVADERILAICDEFLLDYCDRYQIHVTQIIRLMPGQGQQMLHRDRDAWGQRVIPPGIEPQLNTLWALTDFTAENGATQIVPGSHKWEREREPKPAEVKQAVMPRGSVLIFTGSVIHGGGANNSNSDRVGLNLDYCLGWLRQEENQYLSCPPPIARTLEPRLQELLGYTMCSYALGYFSPPEEPGSRTDMVPPEYALGRMPKGEFSYFGKSVV